MTDLQTPLDFWLHEQGRMTAVERFARWHEQDTFSAPRYRELMPLTVPQAGEQYAFDVDLDICTGCKACVAACHSLNGLDETESWRSVGLLYAVESGLPLQQSVTTACHHCVDPACMNGCPVDAYEKDPVTGIVSHLDDQCIGCRYCVLTCPYEVPQFNERLGIVRKCDMCADRLSAGEAPACVQSCPNEAIRITVVSQQTMVTQAARGEFLAGTPDPTLTVPTTVYRSKRSALASAVPADFYRPHLAEGHPPLVIMLVLTQLAVGAAVVDTGLRLGGQTHGAAGPLVALGAGVVALAASVFHLGRPHLAWRALIGLSHSWLSREILAFGVFAGMASLYAAVSWWAPLNAALPSWSATALGITTAVAGAAGVACSAMIYISTRRVWWRARFTASKFLLTTALCGLMSTLVTMLLGNAASETTADFDALVRVLALTTLVGAGVKLVSEAHFLTHAGNDSSDELARSAQLLRGPLAAPTRLRFRVGAAGGIAAPLLLALLSNPSVSSYLRGGLALIGLLLFTAGELLERSLYFRAASPPRMPGGVA